MLLRHTGLIYRDVTIVTDLPQIARPFGLPHANIDRRHRKKINSY